MKTEDTGRTTEDDEPASQNDSAALAHLRLVMTMRYYGKRPAGLTASGARVPETPSVVRKTGS
jgi:hypothetical protein